MKRIRSFEINENFLIGTVVFYSDQDDVELPFSATFTFKVAPSDDSFPWCQVEPSTPDVPLNLLIEETQYFLNLLKMMYYA